MFTLIKQRRDHVLLAQNLVVELDPNILKFFTESNMVASKPITSQSL